MTYLLIFLASCASTAVLTGAVRRYALRAQVLDLPNARSLHAAPTPRGGGLGVVPVVLLVQLAAAIWFGDSALPAGLTVLVAGGLAYVGWRDDRKPLSARLRFGVQIIVSLFSVSTLWALHPTNDLAIWYVPLLALAMTWFINLYNFMDGSDGLAGSQAVLGGLGIGALALAGGVSEIAATSFALAGASLGFLYWNWSPARIFMGDVGSYFLGGLFALLLLRGILSTGAPWRWLMVFAPFITDATLTLLARMLRRQRWWEAHREHAYQRLILKGWAHAQVALAYGVFSLVSLGCALLSAQSGNSGLGVMLLVYGLAATLWGIVQRHATAGRQL
ncbi:MAG: glycosyltransferase family 4 protein [Gammaproteobacteria bacterium]|nr:glycosyltransferase family 4 protein [Gammaproteobacteria bacterium]